MLNADTTKSLVTEDMRQYAKALRLALEPFVEVHPTMPIQYVMSFLRVVEKEGLGVGEYARDAGVSKTVMTRHLLDLGARDRHGGEGFDMITQRRDVQDLRINRSYITHVGAQVLNKAKRAMELWARK
jgi:hypothetical protein